MTKLKNTLIASALAAATVLSGCASTTMAGSVAPARKQMMLLSYSEVMQKSDEFYSYTIMTTKSQGTLDKDPALVARLQRIADNLIPHAVNLRPDASNWGWKVHAVTEDTLNAYVLPNAKIVFYTGIINRLKLTDSEIAAIMGHEMAHALREHTREKLSRNVATGTTLGLASSALGLGGTAQGLVGLSANLGLQLPFSRAQEAEADKIGLELMARAGYNPYAAVTVWEKMMGASSNKGRITILSTHPAPQTRINDLKELQPLVTPLYQAAPVKRG